MLHISLRLVLRSARGADFDDRLLFHSGVTDIILRHFCSLPTRFHLVLRDPRRDTASTRSKARHPMFGRSQFANFAPNRCRTRRTGLVSVDPTRLPVDEAAFFFKERRYVSELSRSFSG